MVLNKKMLPPHNRALSELAREEGISEATQYHWRKEARAQGRLLPAGDQTPEGWTSRDKFAAVLAMAALSEAEVGEYCRRRGLHPEQIRAWRAACEQANDLFAPARIGRSIRTQASRASRRPVTGPWRWCAGTTTNTATAAFVT